jgi:hypothetical protein
LGIAIPIVSAQSNTLQYQQSAGMVTLTTDEIEVKVTGNNQAPHFQWWDPNNPTVDYHVMFVKMFEANDTNENGAFDIGTDSMVGPVFALPTINWEFSGFDTDTDGENVTAVHFNFTTTATHDPRPVGQGGYGELPPLSDFELTIQVRVHMDLSEPGEFKFDLIVEGWEWTFEDSIFVLQFTITESNHGQNQGERDPAGFQEMTQFNFTFGAAYMECADEALAAQNTLEVKASHGEGTGLEAGESVYLAFEYFGNETLEYDPILGIDSTTTGLDSTVLLLAGAGVAIVVIAIVALRARK